MKILFLRFLRTQKNPPTSIFVFQIIEYSLFVIDAIPQLLRTLSQCQVIALPIHSAKNLYLPKVYGEKNCEIKFG